MKTGTRQKGVDWGTWLVCHTSSLDDKVISSEEQRYEQSDWSTQPCLYHSPSPGRPPCPLPILCWLKPHKLSSFARGSQNICDFPSELMNGKDGILIKPLQFDKVHFRFLHGGTEGRGWKVEQRHRNHGDCRAFFCSASHSAICAPIRNKQTFEIFTQPILLFTQPKLQGHSNCSKSLHQCNSAQLDLRSALFRNTGSPTTTSGTYKSVGEPD